MLQYIHPFNNCRMYLASVMSYPMDILIYPGRTKEENLRHRSPLRFVFNLQIHLRALSSRCHPPGIVLPLKAQCCTTSVMDIDDILASVDRHDTSPESAALDHQLLTRLWVAERAVSELLPWPAPLMERMMERVRKQVSIPISPPNRHEP